MNEFLKRLKSDPEILEGYILVREVRVFLEVGHPGFHPEVKIRLWLGEPEVQLANSL